MSKIRRTTDDQYYFFCPGCNMHHAVNNTWTFNGDYENPTFSPSVLVRGTKMTDKGQSDYQEWSSSGHPPRDKPFESVPTVCHSFVRDGKIEYLSDCTHELAGKTVDIEDIERD